MTNFILFLDVTTGRFQKHKPIISNPLLLFFLNLSWHVFYATMGFTLASSSFRVSVVAYICQSFVQFPVKQNETTRWGFK